MLRTVRLDRIPLQSKASVIALALLALLLHSASILNAQKVYTPEAVPNVQLADSTRFVSDEAGILSQAQEAAMNSLLLSIRQKHRVEFAVVVLPSIGNEVLEDFGLQLARHWGLGLKEANNGLLLLMVMDQRRVRFETGYGLEGDLTDAKLAQIIRNEIIPEYRKGDFSQGLYNGVAAVSAVLDGSYVAPDTVTTSRGDEISWSTIIAVYLLFMLLLNTWFVYQLSSIRKNQTHITAVAEYEQFRLRLKGVLALLFFLFLPGFIFTYFWANRREKILKKNSELCPVCHSQQMHCVDHLGERLALLESHQQLEERLNSRTYRLYQCANCENRESIAIDNPQSAYKTCPNCKSKTLQYLGKKRVLMKGRRMLRLDWHCLNCGKDYTDHRRDDSEDDSALFGAVLGSMLGSRGGGFGGGGFGGGGFGGGGFGGGGASGGW